MWFDNWKFRSGRQLRTYWDFGRVCSILEHGRVLRPKGLTYG